MHEISQGRKHTLPVCMCTPFRIERSIDTSLFLSFDNVTIHMRVLNRRCSSSVSYIFTSIHVFLLCYSKQLLIIILLRFMCTYSVMNFYFLTNKQLIRKIRYCVGNQMQFVLFSESSVYQHFDFRRINHGWMKILEFVWKWFSRGLNLHKVWDLDGGVTKM